MGSVIVAGARTPIGKFAGAFKDVPAVSLGGHAIRAALERSNVQVYVANLRRRPSGGYLLLRNLGEGSHVSNKSQSLDSPARVYDDVRHVCRDS